eukprot:CAMPEP_0115069886 /NCGR_PEP_ID=MMETSP0227-20121206/12806_1 /TAXON_ID=89957 /ORGANISM="Polarella glacialis, Strain CCMP 1383" /LENGTH=106 /DNA_ID=CAMNT_0002456337 /DNA_START=364 /DNA_END=684 /DNA_ORIENTATION=-
MMRSWPARSRVPASPGSGPSLSRSASSGCSYLRQHRKHPRRKTSASEQNALDTIPTDNSMADTRATRRTAGATQVAPTHGSWKKEHLLAHLAPEHSATATSSPMVM